MEPGLNERVEFCLDLMRKGEREQAFFDLIEESPEVLPLLMMAFAAEKDPEVRESLVEVIGEHRVRESIPFLTRALDDDDPRVWKTALDALVTAGGEPALAALEAHRTRATKPDRQEWIAEAMGQIHDSLHADASPEVEPEGGAAAVRSKEELISFFEKMDYVIVQGREEYDLIIRYIGKNNIPTWTRSDEKAGTVTIHKRTWGSIEGFCLPL
jgi:hypothetical protein